MANIIVQVADPQWTTLALHLASALARNIGGHVTLLYLMPVRNPGLCDSALGASCPGWQQQKQFHEYGAICEDYGVDCVLQPMQYVTYAEALCDAAVILKANASFVKKPDSHFSLWNRFLTWRLHKAMRSIGCQLYLVDTDTRMIDWVEDHLTEQLPTRDVDYPIAARVLN
jgi:hypothetical protein